ncbi:MAG TPA: hypothetical protein PLR20_07560 [Syntrophales bacterium]|nr:hypothetical protein [Syntrophales bacterium]HOX93315.1 hypothetical protein [Syntrophales bacterium]HPI56516.1 hypothetical protein [Syntrophales bacterium]HPN25063.1 hypothetical protein [Syntrophales bacterium]HQM29194.1 hypothetical protein [Syntrophales bacterium]
MEDFLFPTILLVIITAVAMLVDLIRLALASLVAGAVASIRAGPRRIKEKITHLRGNAATEGVKVEGPSRSLPAKVVYASGVSKSPAK